MLTTISEMLTGSYGSIFDGRLSLNLLSMNDRFLVNSCDWGSTPKLPKILPRCWIAIL